MNEPCFYRVSVKGIVIDELGRILLTREDNGLWEMLGGGLEHGEDPIECLKREIKEEADLEVTHVSPNPKYFLTTLNLRVESYTANIIYQIELKNLNFTPSEECAELRFFSLLEMQQLNAYPNVKRFVEILTAEQAESQQSNSV